MLQTEKHAQPQPGTWINPAGPIRRVSFWGKKYTTKEYNLGDKGNEKLFHPYDRLSEWGFLFTGLDNRQFDDVVPKVLGYFRNMGRYSQTVIRYINSRKKIKVSPIPLELS